MISICGVLACLVSFTAAATPAIYELTFTGTFSQSDVSQGYPQNAHFSPLVGATHNADGGFWQPNSMASFAVERVAEDGNSAALRTILATAKDTGTTGDFIETASLNGLFSGPKSTTIQFEVNEDKPFISLISMVAPSPDWFVGIYGVSLIEAENWVPTLTIGLKPWDAGTEDGIGFSLNNPPSNPKQPISSPVNSPFLGTDIASITFTLIEGNIEPPAPEPVIVIPAITSLLLE